MKCRHCPIFLLLLGCLFSSPNHADEACMSEYAQMKASSGKPEYEQAYQAAKACETRASEQKKKDFAETRTTWEAGLDPLTSGGWELAVLSWDGTYAVFGSRRHETRKGSTVAVWFRYEFREQQSSNGTYKSAVERDLYDCERNTTKTVSATYYGENNLVRGGSSYTYDDGKVTWVPIIPGSLADQLLEWACRTPRAQPAKAH